MGIQEDEIESRVCKERAPGTLWMKNNIRSHEEHTPHSASVMPSESSQKRSQLRVWRDICKEVCRERHGRVPTKLKRDGPFREE